MSLNRVKGRYLFRKSFRMEPSNGTTIVMPCDNTKGGTGWEGGSVYTEPCTACMHGVSSWTRLLCSYDLHSGASLTDHVYICMNDLDSEDRNAKKTGEMNHFRPIFGIFWNLNKKKKKRERKRINGLI